MICMCLHGGDKRQKYFSFPSLKHSMLIITFSLQKRVSRHLVNYARYKLTQLELQDPNKNSPETIGCDNYLQT